MQQLSGKEAADMVEDFIHQETQVDERSVTLTVSSIERLQGTPEFDFGGSEFESVDYQIIEPEKRDADDDYGWWNLDKGLYVMEFNEGVFIPEDYLAVLQGWWRLTVNGLLQPTQTVQGDHPEFHQMLKVPGNGAEIKENARVSEIRVFE